jgi:RNA polymerase sigma-70 factor, ECF subfamily
MANGAVAEQERMRRFRDAALLHLDEIYTIARYLMRNTDDAEDVVQECYLRALRHFDSYGLLKRLKVSCPLWVISGH